MPHLINQDHIMELLRIIQETTKEPHTLEGVNQAQQIVRHGHIRLMELLLDMEDLTKEPHTLRGSKKPCELWSTRTTSSWISC
jgi:hypothetical protein